MCVKGHFCCVQSVFIPPTLSGFGPFYSAQPLLCLSAGDVTTFRVLSWSQRKGHVSNAHRRPHLMQNC